MKKILYYLSLVAIPAIAQTPSMQWQKTINGLSSGYDDSRKAWKDANGNYYITGTSSNDAFVIKADANGNALLKFTYDGPQSNTDYGFDVKADAAGNIYLGGITVFNNVNAPFIAKFNATGTKIWEYVQSGQLGDGAFSAIALDNYSSPANIYYTGSRNDSAITAKVNSNSGALVWFKVFDPGQILDIDIDNNAHPLVCGYIANSGTNNPDLFAAQLDINNGYPQRYYTWDGSVTDSVDHSFGTQHFDKGTKIKAGPAGTFAVLGSVYNNVGRATIAVLKWGSAGSNPIWVYTSNAPTTYTEGEGVQLQADASFSNFYYVARANSTTGGYTTYSIVGKVNGSGSSVWEKEYVQGCSSFDPQDLAVDGNGNAHMVANGNNGGYDIYYLKLSSTNGSIVSNLVYDNLRGGGNAYDIVYSVYVDNTGHPYFFGSSDGYTYTQMDALMVRLNTNSTLDWDEVFDFFVNTNDKVFKMHLFPPVGWWGDQILTCGTVYNNITNQDAVITSYDEMGNVLFQATFDENNDNESVIGFERLANYSNYLCTSSGSNPVTITQYYADGTINGTPSHPTFTFTSPPQQYALDTMGNSFVTANSYNSDDYALGIFTAGYVSVNNAPNTNFTSSAYCSDVVSDNLNNAYVAGVHLTNNGALRKIMVQKYDLSGNKLWSTELVGLDSTSAYIGFITKMAYDRISSSIYVEAFVQTVGSSNVKTALARIDLNGNVVWMKTYDAGGTRNELMTAIVVKNGFIYLTGVGQSVSNQSDNFEAIEKWDVNGNFIWGNSYNGPVANANERGDGIVVDNAGNVYVTGICNEVSGANGDILTLKYDANGNQLWKQEFNGAYNGEDDATGIALSLTNTTNPRVYVCGTTQGGQGLYADIVTLKYCDLPAATVSYSGSTSICQNSSVTLASANVGSGSIVWNNGQTGGSAVAGTSGPYYFTYSEADGCAENSDTVTINIKGAPTPVQICMVTVDDSSKHNLVIWDKTAATPDVIGFNIYREDLTNIYHQVGSVPITALSEFVDLDPVANPNTNTKRYKMTTVDSCGNESPMSNYHNTIYILSNGSGQFNWSLLYTIENTPNPVAQYILLRDDYNTNNWHAVDSTAGTQFSIVDANFSTFQPTANWRVVTQWNIQCTPTQRLANGNSVQATVVKSKSNITNNRMIGIGALNETNVAAYPNPAQNALTVTFPANAKTTISLRNLLGEEVYNVTSSGDRQEIDLGKMAAGTYVLQVSNSSGKYIKRVVKE